MSARDNLTFILGEVTLNLYPVNTLGQPVLATPIWSGACTNRMQIQEHWIKSESRPSGRSYPKRRALAPQYEIDIDRLWLLRKVNLADFRPTEQEYVLDIIWQDEDGNWIRKVFYGVTINERSLAAGEADGEFIDGQRFDAEYYVDSSGTATPPAISSSVPMTVIWVGSDGTFTLYVHDPVAYTFTEASAGITTGRATLLYVPNQAGTFDLTFASGSTLALRVSGEVVHAGDFIQSAPKLTDLPRVDFMVGTQRVASVSLAKKLFAFNFEQIDEPADEANRFLIRAGSDTVLTLGASGVKADDFAQDL
jgi:hypothetical protein